MRMGTLSLGNLGATATTSAGFFTGVPGAPNGIDPGDPCYDNSYDDGWVHGVPEIASWAITDATNQVSAAETACEAGQLATINPPSPPTVDPTTGLLVQGTTPTNTPLLSPTTTFDGSCPWYCSLPGSSIFDPTYSVDCASCSSTGLALSTGLILAAVAVFGLYVFAKA
jgi:hypothetical protein